MIKITAKSKEKDGKKGVELNVKMEGKKEDIIDEILTIVNDLPKSLKKTDDDLYHEFTRKQILYSLDHIIGLGSGFDEDEEDDDDDESDES